MALIRLGDYIEPTDVRNKALKFGESSVKGISTSKAFIDTKADLNGVPLNNYKIINLGEFVYVADTSRRGEKIGLAYCEKEPVIVSSIYTSFRVKDENKLNPRFLMMFFNRAEFDRYARFNSWGSARETFTWEDMCDIEFDLPPIEIQKKYVAIYEGLLENLKAYESKLEDLKVMLEIVFDKIKKDNLVKLSELLSMANKTNDNLIVGFDKLRGINENCEFISTRDSVTAEQINKYKIIKRGQYAINFMCLGNFGKFYLAYNNIEENVLVSPACTGMDLKKEIDPYYLMAYLTRSEFQRRCVFEGAGNTRGGINFDDFSSISVPVQSKQIQSLISSIYRLYASRRKISEELKKVISNICPVLVRGAIKEASEVK